MNNVNDPLAENYYALLIAILLKKSVPQSLEIMNIAVRRVTEVES